MKKYGLIGYPLAHSLSAEFFNAKFKTEGIKGHRQSRRRQAAGRDGAAGPARRDGNGT